MKSVGLFHRLIWRGKKRTSASPSRVLGSKTLFEEGFVLLFSHGDYQAAVRAFGLSIQMNPTYERAYLSRGLAYEELDNLQQAIADYSRAIELAPDDAKIHYVRGLAFGHLGMDAEALADLTRAANLGYSLAHNSLRSLRIPPHAGQSGRDTHAYES